MAMIHFIEGISEFISSIKVVVTPVPDEVDRSLSENPVAEIRGLARKIRGNGDSHDVLQKTRRMAVVSQQLRPYLEQRRSS